MTKEDINLFIYDICSKIPYGLICSIYRIDDEGAGWRDCKCNGFYKNKDVYEFYFDDIVSVDNISYIKPYLRPMSSITKEEYEEETALFGWNTGWEHYDWLNAHHFDYRDLIEKGLAIEVTEKNNLYK